jgi:hypothetical protein
MDYRVIGNVNLDDPMQAGDVLVILKHDKKIVVMLPQEDTYNSHLPTTVNALLHDRGISITNTQRMFSI